jgi:hypothetical protein
VIDVFQQLVVLSARGRAPVGEILGVIHVDSLGHLYSLLDTSPKNTNQTYLFPPDPTGLPLPSHDNNISYLNTFLPTGPPDPTSPQADPKCWHRLPHHLVLSTASYIRFLRQTYKHLLTLDNPLPPHPMNDNDKIDNTWTVKALA